MNILKKPSLATPLGIDWVSFRQWNCLPAIFNWVTLISVTASVFIHPLFLLGIWAPLITLMCNAMYTDVSYNLRGVPTVKIIRQQLKRHAVDVVKYNTEPDLKSVLICSKDSYWFSSSDLFFPEKFEKLSEKELNWIKKTWDQSLNEAIQEKIRTDSSQKIDEIQEFGKKSFGKEVRYHLDAIDELRNKNTLRSISGKENEIVEFDW